MYWVTKAMRHTEPTPGHATRWLVLPLASLILAGCASSPPRQMVSKPTPPQLARVRPVTHAPKKRLGGVLLDRVIAVVNGSPILQSTLDQQMNLLKHELAARGLAIPPRRIFRIQVLRRLIQEKIELEAARLHGITVSEQHVSNILDKIALRNGVPFQYFPTKLKHQGISYVAYRELIRNQLIIHRMISTAVAESIEIPASAVQNYLKAHPIGNRTDYRLKEILIALPTSRNPLSVEEAHNQARAIVAELKTGHPFSNLAVADSAAHNALTGGDMGWHANATLPTAWREALRHLKPGQITPPIATRRGYVILKLTGKKIKPAHLVYAKEYRLRQIVIRPTPVLSSTDARLRLLALRKKLIHGAHWTVLAKAYSDDPTVGLNGGLLGWVIPSTLSLSYRHVLATLPKDQISQPFLTSNGWTLAEILGVRKKNVTQEVLRNRAYNVLFERKLTVAADRFLVHLINGAFVHYLVPWAH
ncbi:SurA domain-containing protein [mine drainage metagenome]|uniref:SurA domain-containing protein n=1 Tax=mine drainage metagenome TaxID=410659 RepID=T1BHA1_9ZZZZ